MVSRPTPRALRGVTLVELMVTLAVMALLMMGGLPFARQWLDDNRQLQARGTLWEAVGEARARAMRNPQGVATGTAVTRVFWSAPGGMGGRNTFEVRSAGQTVWTGPVHPSVGVNALQAPASGASLCLAAYDSRGALLPADAQCQGLRVVQLHVRGEHRGMPDVHLL